MSAAYKNSDKICTADRISNQRISGSVATRLQQQRQIMCFISANIATAAPLKYAGKKAAPSAPTLDQISAWILDMVVTSGVSPPLSYFSLSLLSFCIFSLHIVQIITKYAQNC